MARHSRRSPSKSRRGGDEDTPPAPDAPAAPSTSEVPESTTPAPGLSNTLGETQDIHATPGAGRRKSRKSKKSRKSGKKSRRTKH